ncbi:MAG: carboxylating nicotinate-nucleotide diphosphorylase [Parachlamydiales bacterium]|nr:carboxylating nicotinate-nucleotide diphosphorylase [Parachlamydiales bacterium]
MIHHNCTKKPTTKFYQEAFSLFQKALKEDCFVSDITSTACISPNARGKASLLLKEEGCIAGVNLLPDLLKDVPCTLHVQDGDFCHKGTILATLDGNIRKILGYERPLLNLLQHLSGIATATFRCKQRIKDYACDLLDTRKTIPGLRSLEKYAVRMGGGKNHRISLKESILIKNNHITFLKTLTDRPVFQGITLAKQQFPQKKIEVEVQNMEMLQEALEAKADYILLDNMTPGQIQEMMPKIPPNIYVEASGGIREDNLLEYAKTGVQGISMGALTHSTKALDICLRLMDSHRSL